MSKLKTEDLFGFPHYEYGEAYYGSSGEYRFRLARDPLENVHYTPPDKRGESCLLAEVWKGPLGYAASAPEERTAARFGFSEEGFEEAVRWLNGQMEGTEDEQSDKGADET